MSQELDPELTPQRSAWAVGWTLFAAITLMMVGTFQAIAGLVAIIDDEFYVTARDWTFSLDVSDWGWIHLIIGVLVAIAGLGLLVGNLAARIVGVAIAVLSAIVNFMWLPYYPIWSVIVISLDIAIIWALTIHGRDGVFE